MSEFRLYATEELGTDGYPPEWHKTIKHAVRAEAGHRCVRCRHPYRNGEHGTGEWTPCDALCEHGEPMRDDVPIVALGVKAVERYVDGERQAHWRILTVHHLDGDKANCRWWNLAALCQRCHLTIQGRVVMERAFMFEHSEWFKPYAAGWYAWKYLGEEIGRDEALARLNELLALERVA